MRSIRMRFPNGLAKAFTISYDDGVEQDQKLISLMDTYGISGTFNLNSGRLAPEGTVYAPGNVHRVQTKAACLALYKNKKNIEVAIHGVNHPFLERIPPMEAMQEILNDRKALENMFGCFVNGCAYPFGTYNDDVVEILRLCGIKYARTTIARHDFAIPTDWLRMSTTCRHKDPMLMGLVDKFLADSVDKEAELFYLWGHSYEFEESNNWDVIENTFKKVGLRTDIWYATNIEVYNYVEAFRKLEYSADAHKVYNPTQLDIWVAVDNEIVLLPAGQTTGI